MKKLKIGTLFLAIALNFTEAYSQWNLTGNASTSPPTNFLGTTDQQPLVFKVNNLFSGLLDYDANKANTAFGHQSLISLSTGAYNSSFGYLSLYSNTTGGANTASGMQALTSNVSGWNNTAIGAFSMNNSSSGNDNTGLGSASLNSNTSGSQNSAVGMRSLYLNTSGSLNTATGYYSLSSNTIGDYNTSMGASTLYSNTTGSGNTATGYQALYSNTTGVSNTSSGIQSLYYNTTGDINTATGYYSLLNNTTGYGNSALGYAAGVYNTTGAYNTAIGFIALQGNTSGYANIGIGFYALSTNTTGNYNTAIGYQADANSNNYSYSMALGYYASVSASNQVRVQPNATSIGSTVGWTTLSDGRIKKNVKSDVPGLTFINKLSPVTYTLDLSAMDNIIQRHVTKDKNGNIIQPSKDELAAKKQKEQIIYSGFIAQDVESASKSSNYNFSGVDAPKNDKDVYGLRYAEFVVPLVKAVQELSLENDKKEKVIEELRNRINQLQSQMNAILEGLASTGKLTEQNMQRETLGSYLEQNSPNPFNVDTRIRYHVPASSAGAILTITNASGLVMKTISLQSKGNGQLSIAARELTPGVYFYSLTVDGKKIDTRQMIITR